MAPVAVGSFAWERGPTTKRFQPAQQVELVLKLTAAGVESLRANS